MAPPNEDVIKKLAKGEIKRPQVDEIIRDYAKDEDVERLSALIENGSLKANQIIAIINGTYSLTKKVKEDGSISISLHFDIVSGPKSSLDGPLHINVLNRLLDKQVDTNKKKHILSGLIPENDIDFVVKLLNEGRLNLSELEAVLRKDYGICSFGDSLSDAELKILIPLDLIFENGKFDAKQLQMILDGRYTPNQLVAIFNNQFNADEIRALFNIKIDLDTLKGLLKGNFEIKRTPMADGGGYIIELTYKRESYKQYLQDILDGKYPFDEVLQLFGGRIGVEELQAILSMGLSVAQLHALICGDYVVERKENPDGSYSIHMTYNKGAGDVTEIPEIHRDDDEISEEGNEIKISCRSTRLPFEAKEIYEMSKGTFNKDNLKERIKIVTNENDAPTLSELLLNKKLSENEIKTLLKVLYSVNISDKDFGESSEEELTKIKDTVKKIYNKTINEAELREILKENLEEKELNTVIHILMSTPLSEEEIHIILKNVKNKGPANIKLTKDVIDNIVDEKYDKKKVTRILENFLDKENVNVFLNMLKNPNLTKEQKNVLVRTIVSNASNFPMKEVEIKKLLNKNIDENELKDILSDRIQPEDFETIKSLLTSGKLTENEVRVLFKGPVKETHVVLSEENIDDIVKGNFNDNDLNDIIGNYVSDYYLTPVVDLLTKKNLTEPEKRSIVKTVLNANIEEPLGFESIGRIISDKDTNVIENTLSDKMTKDELKALKDLVKKDKLEDDTISAIFSGKSFVPDYCMNEETMQKIIDKDCSAKTARDLLKPYVTEKYITSVVKFLTDKNVPEPKKRAFLTTMMINLKNPVKAETLKEIMDPQTDDVVLKDALKSHCSPDDIPEVVELIKNKTLNNDQMRAMLGGKAGPIVSNEKRINIVEGKIPKYKLENIFAPLVAGSPTKIIDILCEKRIPEEKKMALVDTLLKKPEVSPKPEEDIEQIASGKIKQSELKTVLTPNVNEADVEKFMSLMKEGTLSGPTLVDLLGPIKAIPLDIKDSDREKIINLSSDYDTIKSIIEPLVQKESLEPTTNLLMDSSLTPTQRESILDTLLRKPTVKPISNKDIEKIVTGKVTERELKKILEPNLTPKALPVIVNLMRSDILTPEQIRGLIGEVKEIPFQISPNDKEKLITGKCDKNEAKMLLKHFMPMHHLDDVTELFYSKKIGPESKAVIVDILNRKPIVEPKPESTIAQVAKKQLSPEEVQNALIPNVEENEIPVITNLLKNNVLNDKHLSALLGPIDAKRYEIDAEDKKELIHGICHPEKINAIFEPLIPKQSMNVIVDVFQSPKISESQKSAILNTILAKPTVKPKTVKEVESLSKTSNPAEIGKTIENNVDKADIPVMTALIEGKILQEPHLKAILGPVTEPAIELSESDIKSVVSGKCSIEKLKTLLNSVIPSDLHEEVKDVFDDEKISEAKKRAFLKTILKKPEVSPKNAEDIKNLIFEKIPDEDIKEKIQTNISEKDVKPIVEMIRDKDMNGNQIQALLGPAQYVPLILTQTEKDDLINGRCPSHVVRALLAPVMPKKFTSVTAQLFENPELKPEEKKAILNAILNKPLIPKLENDILTKVCDLQQPRNEKVAMIQPNTASKEDSELISDLILNEKLNPNHIQAIFGDTKDPYYDISSAEKKDVIDCNMDKAKLQDILKPLVPTKLIQPTIEMLTNKNLSNDQRRAILDTLLLKVNVIPLDTEIIKKIIQKEYSLPELEKVILPNVETEDLPILCSLITKNKLSPSQIEALFGPTEELPYYLKNTEKKSIIEGKIQPQKLEDLLSNVVSTNLLKSVEEIFKNDKLTDKQKTAVLDTLLNKPQSIPLDEENLLNIVTNKKENEVKAIIKPNVNNEHLDVLTDLVITDSLTENQIKAIFGAKEEETYILSKADIDKIINGHCNINKLRELLSLILPAKHVESFVQFFMDKERTANDRKAVLETLLNIVNVTPLCQASLREIQNNKKKSDKVRKIIQPVVKSANLDTLLNLIVNNKLNENQINVLFGRPEIGPLTNKQIDDIVHRVYSKEKTKELLSVLIDSTYLDSFIDVIFQDAKLTDKDRTVILNVTNEKFVHPTMSDEDLKKLTTTKSWTRNELKKILPINKQDSNDFIELLLNDKLEKNMITAIFSGVKTKHELQGVKSSTESKEDEEEFTDQKISDITDGSLNREEIELILSNHISPQEIEVVMNIIDNKSLKNPDKKKLIRTLTQDITKYLKTSDENLADIDNAVTDVEKAKKFLKPYVDNMELPDFTDFVITSITKKEDIKALFKTLAKTPRIITESDIQDICSGKLSDKEVVDLLSPFMTKEEASFFPTLCKNKSMKEDELKEVFRTINRKFTFTAIVNNVIRNVIHKRYTKSQLTEILRPYITDGELRKTVNLLLEGPFNTDELTTMVQLIVHRLPIPVLDSDIAQIESKKLSHRQIGEILSRYIGGDDVAKVINTIMETASIDAKKVRPIIEGIWKKSSIISVSEDYLKELVSNKYEETHEIEVVSHYAKREDCNAIHKIIFRSKLDVQERLTLLKSLMFSPKAVILSQDDIVNISTGKMTVHQLNDCLGGIIGQNYIKDLVDILRRISIKAEEKQTLLLGILHKSRKAALSVQQITEIVQREKFNELDTAFEGFLTGAVKKSFINILSDTADIKVKKALIKDVLCQTYEPLPPLTENTISSVLDKRGATRLRQALEYYTNERDNQEIAKICTNGTLKQTQAKYFIQATMHKSYFNPFSVDDIAEMQKSKFAKEILASRLKQSVPELLIEDLCKTLLSGKLSTDEIKVLLECYISSPVMSKSKTELTEVVMKANLKKDDIKEFLMCCLNVEDYDNICDLILSNVLNAEQRKIIADNCCHQMSQEFYPNQKMVDTIFANISNTEILRKLIRRYILPLELEDVLDFFANTNNNPEDLKNLINILIKKTYVLVKLFAETTWIGERAGIDMWPLKMPETHVEKERREVGRLKIPTFVTDTSTPKTSRFEMGREIGKLKIYSFQKTSKDESSKKPAKSLTKLQPGRISIPDYAKNTAESRKSTNKIKIPQLGDEEMRGLGRKELIIPTTFLKEGRRLSRPKVLQKF